MRIVVPFPDDLWFLEPELGQDLSKELGEVGDQGTDEGDVHFAHRPYISSTQRKLQLREIGMAASFTREKFGRFKNETIIDMYEDRSHLLALDSWMRKRSEIVKILSVKDVIILLSNSGVGCTFSRVTNKMIALLTRCGETIEDIHYNKLKGTVIVSSSTKVDDYTSKIFREIPIRLLRTKDNIGTSIFETEEVKWPGLLEFDAINDKALISHGGTHKVFDLNNYSLMYMIPEINVPRVLCRPEALLVVQEHFRNHLQLVIRCIKTGDMLSSIYHPIEGKLEFLEMFHEKVLVKERAKGLQIIDIKNSEKQEVPIGCFQFHPLYGRNVFLTFQKDSSEIRTLNGRVVQQLENALWRSSTIEHRICSTSGDDTIIYVGTSKASGKVLVNICTIERGVSVATFEPDVQVSSLSYNEDLNEIYTGTTSGMVYVYSV